MKTVATKDKGKIDAFFKANPDTTNQGAWLKARPTPASYATADYFGVHTFTLINAKGDRQPIKWKGSWLAACRPVRHGSRGQRQGLLRRRTQ